jgi:hypothetical protein
MDRIAGVALPPDDIRRRRAPTQEDLMTGPIPFRISALPIDDFQPLFDLGDSELLARGMRRMIADAKPGFPCRVSLVDAEIGERLILLSHPHHSVPGPYRASGPIFVREAAAPATLEVNEVPESVRRRRLSVRAYDRTGLMVAAEVTEGVSLEAAVARLFADDRVPYLHVHNAGAGCYNCRVDRA